MNILNMPGFTAEASFYKTSERYQPVTDWNVGTSGQGITPQQGLTPTPSAPFYRCGPCIRGQQFCCPPPGVGAPCYIQRCRRRYIDYQG